MLLNGSMVEWPSGVLSKKRLKRQREKEVETTSEMNRIRTK
jgi:hypothetical protein